LLICGCAAYSPTQRCRAAAADFRHGVSPHGMAVALQRECDRTRARPGRHQGQIPRLPISEIELELRTGRPEDIFDWRCRSRALPVHLGGATKAARGFGLLSDAEPAPVKATAGRAVATMTARDGLAAAPVAAWPRCGPRGPPLAWEMI